MAENPSELDSTFKNYIQKYIHGEDKEHETHVSVLLRRYFIKNMTKSDFDDLTERLVVGAAVELEHTFFMLDSNKMKKEDVQAWTVAIDPILGLLALLDISAKSIPLAELDRIFVSTILSIALSHLTETLFYYDYLESVEEKGKVRRDDIQKRWFGVLEKSLVPEKGLARQKRISNGSKKGNNAGEISRIIGERLQESQSISKAMGAANPSFPAMH